MGVEGRDCWQVGEWGGQGFEPVAQLLVLELNAVEVFYFFFFLATLRPFINGAAAAAFANWSHLTRSAFDAETAAVAFGVSGTGEKRLSVCPSKGQRREFGPLITFLSARF